MPKKSNKMRSDGRIAVQIYLGTVDGKRKYKTVYGKTQKEANAKADELRLSMSRGLDITAQKDTFAAWAKRWYDIKQKDVGNAQQEAYKGYLKHALRYVGNMPVGDVRLADLQQCITDLAQKNPSTGKPTSKRTLEGLKQTMAQVFNFCMENDVILRNPAQFLRVPKNAPKEKRRAITEQERQWILTTEHRMKTAAMIMLFSGLRRGELIALTWADIDLEKGTITVDKAIEFIGNDPTVKRPKTKAGIRTIYIPNILTEYLKNLPRSSTLVCPTLGGGYFTKSSFVSSWQSYLSEMDYKNVNYVGRTSKFDPRFHGITIDPITPHMLRHTFCTDMIKNGVNIKTAQQQMGHEKVETTLNIYAHFFSENDNANEMKKNERPHTAHRKKRKHRH